MPFATVNRAYFCSQKSTPLPAKTKERTFQTNEELKDAYPYPDADDTSINKENDVPIKAYLSPEGAIRRQK